jgi:hypothetical protein
MSAEDYGFRRAGVCLMRPNPVTGKTTTLLLNTTYEKIERFLTKRNECPLVQEMFPELTDSEREFLLTGLGPDDWAAMWKDEV